MAEAKAPKAPKQGTKRKARAEEPKEKQVKHAEVVAETVPVGEAPEVKIEIEKVTAKAGKRSAKAAREEEAKEAKEDRKSETKRPETAAKAKPTPPPRLRNREPILPMPIKYSLIWIKKTLSLTS
jgi:hypothetical protein